MKNSLAIFLIAICAMNTGAIGQNLIQQSTPAGCPLPAEVSPQHLYGQWRAELAGLPEAASIRFGKHPELIDSVSGTVLRDGVQALLAGDVDEGELTLEESLDGEHISATWLGTVVENSCSKEIRGTWNNASNNSSVPFILRKLPGWQ